MSRDDAAAALRVNAAREQAIKSIGSYDLAVAGFESANPSLSNQRPETVAAESDDGLRRVLQILGRIEYGVYD